MKKLYLILILVFIAVSFDLNAQAITYDLRCSADHNKYELYVTRNTTPVGPTIVAGGRVTLVFPTGTSRTVLHTSTVSTYSILPAIINPGGNGNDYHGFSTGGGEFINGGILVANVPKLWMTFEPSDGTTQNTRLFINGTDPESTDPGMGNVDLTNVFTTSANSAGFGEYTGNVSNIVNCAPLGNNDIASLNSLSLYPNPASSQVTIKGAVSELEKVEIITINGQLVKRIDTNLNTIDISQLDDAMYFVKLYHKYGVKNLKLIKE